jgi:cadmium resistance protein CadD (predicted permease)
MNRFLSELLVAIIAFASTNVDDLLLLSSLFIDADLHAAAVVIGQFVGMSLLVLISVLATYYMLSVPSSWIGLIGIVPLGLGIFRLAKIFKWGAPKPRPGVKKVTFVGKEQWNAPWIRSQVAFAAVLTLANGGDNLSVYIPLFAVQRTFIPLYVVTFSVMTGIWCYLGYFLTNHDIIREKLRRYAVWIVPWVLIALGLKVLLRTG